MDWKFQREDHNRQDKTQKAHYRESFSEPHPNGGSYELRIRSFDIFNGSLGKKYAAQVKIEAANFIERHLRSTLVRIGKYEFRFRMSATEFAAVNKLPSANAVRIFNEVRAEALQRLAMTKNSAIRAEFSLAILQREPEMKTALEICFKNFLQPIKPIEWDKIYKKVRLNPIPVQPKTD